MFNKIQNKKLIMLAIAVSYLALSQFALAQVNVAINSSLNLAGGLKVTNPPDLINAVYKWSIGFAAVSAFAMIVYNGIVWMISEAIDKKGDARQGIIDAVTGLVLILSAVLIFNTIDPNLTKLRLEGRGANRAVSKANFRIGAAVKDTKTGRTGSRAACDEFARDNQGRVISYNPDVPRLEDDCEIEYLRSALPSETRQQQRAQRRQEQQEQTEERRVTQQYAWLSPSSCSAGYEADCVWSLTTDKDCIDKLGSDKPSDKICCTALNTCSSVSTNPQNPAAVEEARTQTIKTKNIRMSSDIPPSIQGNEEKIKEYRRNKCLDRIARFEEENENYTVRLGASDYVQPLTCRIRYIED